MGRIFSSSFSNVVQKKLAQQGLHPLFIVFASYVVLSIISIPFLLTFESFNLPTEFWLNIFFAALLDMAGTLFLVMSLSKTDLSVFGPLNAYKVVISMFLAMIFIGEIPSKQGFIGVATIVIGSYFLFPAKSTQGSFLPLFLDKGVQYRFLSILLFSIGTLPLKSAVVSGGVLPTTVFWCLFGLPLATLIQWRFVHHHFAKDLNEIKSSLAPIIFLACLIFMMQYTTMLVLSEFLIVYSLALFQLSMLLQVVLGHQLFNEKNLFRRLSACLVMVAGSLLVLNA